MKPFNVALLTLAFLAASCATKVSVAKNPENMMGVKIEAHCFSLPNGITVVHDGTTNCPDQLVVEEAFIEANSGKFQPINDMRWGKLQVTYTSHEIDCSEPPKDGVDRDGIIPTTGCSYIVDGTVLNSWVMVREPTWVVKRTVRHEFMHWAIFLGGGNELDHFCLDNPVICEDLK